MYFLYYLSSFIPYLIIGLIIFFVVRAILRRRMERVLPSSFKGKEWYLRLVTSRQDAVSQLFLVLSIIFFWVTLSAFNRNLGDPISWRLILLFTLTAGLIIAYYFKVSMALIVSLPMIVIWWTYQTSFWAEGRDIKGSVGLGSIGLIFLIFYLLGRLHEVKAVFKRFSVVYSMLGIISVTALLFFLSTNWGLSVLEGATKGNLLFSSLPLAISFFVLVALGLSLMIYPILKHRKLLFTSELFSICVLFILFLVISFLPQQILFESAKGISYAYTKELTSLGIVWAIIFNILVFLEVVGIIFLGFLRRENYLINLGIFFIFILIFVKYFDWFFTFLNKSLFFIIGGILLFVIGWLMEKGRRKIMETMRNEPQVINR